MAAPKKKMKSGFCGIGSCEGTKPKSPSGKPMKTCEFWETCGCDCHALITKMFEIAEQPRILVDNPEYKSEKSPYWMPSLEDIAVQRAALSNSNGATDPPTLKRPAGDAAPPVLTKSYAPTTSGRAARGELEDWVNEVCGIWVVEKYPWPCTPVYVSDQIAKREGIPAPSTGAITAAFDRWEKLGYAKIVRKPIRFVGFTEEGIRLGLDILKERARRNTKQAKSAAARGIR